MEPQPGSHFQDARLPQQRGVDGVVFPARTAADFDRAVDAFGYEELPYVVAAPRTNVVGRVFTANESPPDQSIPFHHEMAQKLEKCGLIYTRVLGEGDHSSSPIGRGWQSVFATSDKVVVDGNQKSWFHEKWPVSLAYSNCYVQLDATSVPMHSYLFDASWVLRAAARGMELEWTGDRVKTVTGPIPAVKWDERRGRKIWFVNMVAAYTGWKDARNGRVNTVSFGDGSPLPGDIMDECGKILEEECVAIPWQQGDILLIDNWAVLHGRRSSSPHDAYLLHSVNSM
ncbi:unnamed protein product [Miscanthus lutarioriparius]|uniref:TauD/TfdA-like domain-containing protein n=1 Tax=Miscanthus lutarioriparius TaxID=422564 RepID=A0A811PME8_9POAL|nr:unnamed protein product [Miscanthus lutarioriparius]